MAATSVIDPEVFRNAVDATVGRALADHGYRIGVVEDYFVRFESQSAFVAVSYDLARAGELTVWLGQPADRESPLELVDALRSTACEPSQAESVALIQTMDPAALRRLLDRAAALLQRCCIDFLRGDPSAFAGARSLLLARSRHYTAALRNRSALAAADEAWAQHDYQRVHDLLDPIVDALDGPHKRRLEFARKRLEPTP